MKNVSPLKMIFLASMRTDVSTALAEYFATSQFTQVGDRFRVDLHRALVAISISEASP